MPVGYHIHFGVQDSEGPGDVHLSDGSRARVTGPDGNVLTSVKSIAVKQDRDGLTATIEVMVGKVTSGFDLVA